MIVARPKFSNFEALGWSDPEVLRQIGVVMHKWKSVQTNTNKGFVEELENLEEQDWEIFAIIPFGYGIRIFARKEIEER